MKYKFISNNKGSYIHIYTNKRTFVSVNMYITAIINIAYLIIKSLKTI